jgi:hypothetical protein
VPGHWQLPDDVIDVAAWPEDEEYPFFPEGSRDKRLLRCPPLAPHPWLVAGHRYLFKESRAAYPEQFWVEVVASRLSRLTGVPVPASYAAWDSRSDTCAALIEWFYGYPGGPAQGFLLGGMFMKDMIKDFDHVKGRQHNFNHVTLLCHVLDRAAPSSERPFSFEKEWLPTWARILTFDALIGNTDRHQENWGFVWTRQETGDKPTMHLQISPAFDNGTSLGHEHSSENFARFLDKNYLRRYIVNGRHHMKWHLNDLKKCGHVDLLLKIVDKSPECRTAMLSVLQFEPAALDDAVMPLTGLSLPVPLSAERARFMLTMLNARRERLLEALTTP